MAPLKSQAELIDSLFAFRRELTNPRPVKWQSGAPLADGSANSAAWPLYEPWVDEGLNAGYDMFVHYLNGDAEDLYLKLGFDARAEISQAGVDEVAAWFLNLKRGERFSDGYIAAAIEDGFLLELVERALELAQSPAQN